MKRSARYCKIPKDLLLDISISGDAVRIYGVLALWVFQGNVARIGMRRIGREVGLSAATVCRRLQELAAAGYISAGSVKPGERAYYVLNSEVFGQKQRAGTEEIVSYPQPRLATVRIA